MLRVTRWRRVLQAYGETLPLLPRRLLEYWRCTWWPTWSWIKEKGQAGAVGALALVVMGYAVTGRLAPGGAATVIGVLLLGMWRAGLTLERVPAQVRLDYARKYPDSTRLSRRDAEVLGGIGGVEGPDLMQAGAEAIASCARSLLRATTTLEQRDYQVVGEQIELHLGRHLNNPWLRARCRVRSRDLHRDISAALAGRDLAAIVSKCDAFRALPPLP